MIGKLIGWLRKQPETTPLPDALWQAVVSALPFLGALDADYTCPAIAPSVLGIDAFWVFLRQGAP